VKQELLQVGNHFSITNIEDVKKLLEAEKALLKKYANLPTLSEFASDSAYKKTHKWGSTFGVAVLVQELILEKVYKTQKQCLTSLPKMLTLILQEMTDPKFNFLYECLEKNITYKISSDVQVSDEQKKTLIENLSIKFIETFMNIGKTYGICENITGAVHSITPLGSRVLLHLIDSQVFVDNVIDAHKKFQNKKPRLNFV
jgi:hypothetical protein